MCTERKATGEYVLACFLSATMWKYMFTECVTKSCDPPDWLIQTCYQSASSRVTETVFLTWPCEKYFKNCFNVDNLIIVSLSTVIPIIDIV